MELGNNIIKIRKENKLTQDDLAKKYFVTRQTISNWENSKSYPDLETLAKISDDFNISLDVLLKEDKKMVKNISDKQKSFKFLKAFSICLNIIGVICLIYFMIPYVTHDMSIKNPNAMLAGYIWDSCGFVLCLGLIPLVIANTLLFVSFQGKKILKALFYIPSVICLITVCHYLFIATDWKEEEPTSEHVVSMKCVTKDSKLFKYSIYKEQNGEYTLGMDEDDKFPLNIVDYSSPDEMINSIESYYKSNGGSCN